MTRTWRAIRRRWRRRWRRWRRQLQRSFGKPSAPPVLDPLARARRRLRREDRRTGFAWALRVRSEHRTVATLCTNDPVAALELVAEAMHQRGDLRPGWTIHLEHLASGRSAPLEHRQVTSWSVPVTAEQVRPLLQQLDDNLDASIEGYTASSSTVQTVGPHREFIDIEQVLRQALGAGR